MIESENLARCGTSVCQCKSIIVRAWNSLPALSKCPPTPSSCYCFHSIPQSSDLSSAKSTLLDSTVVSNLNSGVPRKIVQHLSTKNDIINLLRMALAGIHCQLDIPLPAYSPQVVARQNAVSMPLALAPSSRSSMTANLC